MIPKKLHFTYRSASLPPIYQENLRRWHAYFPDWEMRLYTDQDILYHFEVYFPHYLRDIQRVSLGALKADLFRYAIMHTFGGMYNDLDTIPLATIPDEWLSYESIIGYEYQPSTYCCSKVPSYNEDTLCQWSFLAAPGAELFKDALDQSILALREREYQFQLPLEVLETTGPIKFTQAAKPYLEKPQTLLLDMPYFSPIYLKEIDLSNCIVFHQFHGTTGWKFQLKCPHLKLG